ncbi:hypothetical protein J7E25_00910 [Agromyces sp. ISL-38]|uniref:hypothetical protein n=1 Tax=Agromyces sp. ISL-38 TaxID=2819107 RepID=UPI001BE519CC|nr:hypothetical protein [Agromyces sp. ISL-38]MBT2497650.1 hypothetical protein [Agromyces sp. ISL-38]
MEISLIDPRDTTWELRDPTYRVYFWTVPDSVSYEWRITDAADVHEVIAWAEAERGERTYELFIEHVDRRASGAGEWIEEPGLIRLVGDNPTTGRIGGSVSISEG